MTSAVTVVVCRPEGVSRTTPGAPPLGPTPSWLCPGDIYQRASKQGSRVPCVWLIWGWIGLGFLGLAQKTREENAEALEHFFFPTSWDAPWKLTSMSNHFWETLLQKPPLRNLDGHGDIKDVSSLPPLTLTLPSCQETCLTLFHTVFSNYFTFSLTFIKTPYMCFAWNTFMQKSLQSTDMYSMMRYKYGYGENGSRENKFMKVMFPIIKYKKFKTQLSFS